MLGIEYARIREASPRRRATFSSGRYAARKALAQWGVQPEAIGWSPEGQPIGPSGWSISIAHTDEICLAASASRTRVLALGADIEHRDEVTEELADVIALTPERAAFLSLGIGLGELFAIKEASFKALSPSLPVLEDFSKLRLAPERHGDRLLVTVDVDGMSPSQLPPLNVALASPPLWTACICYAIDG